MGSKLLVKHEKKEQERKVKDDLLELHQLVGLSWQRFLNVDIGTCKLEILRVGTNTVSGTQPIMDKFLFLVL